VQCDLDINSPPEAVPDALKWSFDEIGRLISMNTEMAIDIPNFNVQAGTVLQTWSTNAELYLPKLLWAHINGVRDNQVWIVSDRPRVKGFLLRCKQDPQLVLESYTSKADSVIVRVQRYTGSIWQHWTLTPEGYLASTATDVSGKMMVLDVVGKLLL